MSTQGIEDRIRFLAGQRLEPFQVEVQNHPAWVSNHPSGFGSVSRVTDGDVFTFSPRQIAATTAHLPDGLLQPYLDAIVTWWQVSAMHFTLMLSAGTVLLDFATAHPAEFLILAMNPLVLSGEYDLIDWFCYDQRG